MGAEIWIGGIYFLAALVAVKLFLPIDFAKARFRPKIVLVFLALILFPLWLPFTVGPKWRAWNERQSYINSANQCLTAVEQAKTGSDVIDALIEKIATSPDTVSQRSDAEKLATLSRENAQMRNQTLPKLYDKAQDIYWRNSIYFNLDETLPVFRSPSDPNDPLSTFAPDDNSPSRLWLSFKTKSGKLSNEEHHRVATKSTKVTTMITHRIMQTQQSL